MLFYSIIILKLPLRVKGDIKMKNNMVFVVPKNDAEAIRIAEILINQEIKVLVTAQTWGASWENLEKSIKEELETLQHSHQIYGIELKGNPVFSVANIEDQ